MYPGKDVDKPYYPPFFLNNDITKILTHTHTKTVIPYLSLNRNYFLYQQFF